ncbi:hypothetical protein [Pontibacterium sp.]|uniref:hypothetical protein n=1 Tax=Pontibacterium sp. TaxID=2036026 RepID=UPI0035136FA2
MKTLTSAIALGLVLASGSAVAANAITPTNDKEISFGEGIQFQSATQFISNEIVELDQAAFDEQIRLNGSTYNPELYFGN